MKTFKLIWQIVVHILAIIGVTALIMYAGACAYIGKLG